jgi:hypothetical protein
VQLIAPLPWAVVHDAVKEQESLLEIRTPQLVVGVIKHDIDPMAMQSHSLNDDGAARVIAARYCVKLVEPARTLLCNAQDLHRSK